KRMIRADWDGIRALEARRLALAAESKRLRAFEAQARTRLASLQADLGRIDEPGLARSFRDEVANDFDEDTAGSESESDSEESFAAMRGQLTEPIPDWFEVREAQTGRGVEFLVPEGAYVYAAAEGRVVFAGERAPYKRLVIIEHDRQFFTV